MNQAVFPTAPTTNHSLEAYHVMSFPVMNQLLCRGASSNNKRTSYWCFKNNRFTSKTFIKLSSFFFITFRPFQSLFLIVAKKLGNYS